ncbi:hypothetical protein [Rubrivirga sp. IMCC45206]|uniref:hypothetical protein n=1 Tax=Rubrivirga sp. IMCC45206 TaxID=3391614 RepID=UPI00398F902E
MRIFVLTALVALLTLPGFAPAPTDGARDLNFTVINQTGYTIEYIYASWCTQPNNVVDVLGDYVLEAGERTTVAVNAGCVNFRAITVEGYEFYDGGIVTNSDVYTWTVRSR